MSVTNPGLPPALSTAHHAEEAERVRVLKDELDDLLGAIDAALAALERVDAPPISV